MTSDQAPIAPEELLTHAGFLTRLARRLTHDADGAADLVQEAYRVALERAPTGRSASSLRGWLGTVTTNLARNRWRADSRRGRREAGAARDEASEPEALTLERLEVQRALVEFVLELPTELRTVLHLRYFEDLTPTAIAARLGAPVKTVKARQGRALARLRERLDARSHGDRARWLAALAPLGHMATTGTGAALLGGLAMKKTVTGIGVGLLALVAWQGWRRAELGAGLGGNHEPRVEALQQAGPSPSSRTPVAALVDDLDSASAREPLAPRTAPTTSGALEITLLRSDGTPAADVPVSIQSQEDPEPRARFVRGRTGVDGRFLAEDLPPGPVWVRGPDDRFEARVEAGETIPVTFTLSQAFTVAGTVVDERGAPVAGAEIWGGRSTPHWPGGFLLGRTTVDGGFRIRDVEAFTAIGARKRGFLASRCLDPRSVGGAPDGTRTMRLVLRAGGGGLRGRVLDPEGNAVAGAEVLAGPDGGTRQGDLEGESPQPAHAATDGEGRFELASDLPPGLQPVHVAGRGFPVWQGQVEIVAGRTSEFEVRLDPPARIAGRVLGIDGAPVADVTVLASVEDRGGWYHDRFAPPQDETDAEGRFALDWVAPGERELNAHDRGRPRIGRATVTVACSAGDTAACELRLDLGHTISGRVVDGEGAPLARWKVSSRPPIGHWWYPRDALTGPDGHFTLANLGAGAHDLDVRESVTSQARASLLAVPAGATEVEIVVPDAEVSTGLLRARLVATGVATGVAPGENPQNFTALLWKEGVNEGRFLEIDAAGGIEVGVFPGRYRIEVQRGADSLLATPFAAVEADATTNLGDLVLEASGRVEVELVGLPPQFLERMTVELGREGTNGASLRPAAGPRLSPELMPGTWTLAVNKFALRPDLVDVVPGTTTRVVVLVSPAVGVTLHLVDPTRDAITVEAFDSEGRSRLRRTYFPREQDDFRATIGLAPGFARLVVTTRAGLRAEAEIEVASDRPRDAVVDLEPR